MTNKICEFCNVNETKRGRRFCGRSCSNRWKHKSGILKGGFKKSVFELWKDKYGEEIALKKEKERNEKHSKSITGENNSFFGKDHSEEFKKKSSIIHKNKTISESVRSKMSESHCKSISDGLRDPGNNFGISGWYESTKTNKREFFSSSYEKKRMIYLDKNDDVVSWTKHHKIVIKYEIDGKIRSYSPDLLIETKNGMFLEEIKGWIRNKEEFEKKNEFATKFCESKNWKFRVLFFKDLETL